MFMLCAVSFDTMLNVFPETVNIGHDSKLNGAKRWDFSPPGPLIHMYEWDQHNM